MSCPTERQIACLVDEPEGAEMALETHVSSCPRCREIRARLSKAARQIEQLEETPPEDLDARILKRLKQPARRSNVGLGLAVALGGVALAVALAVVVPSAREPGPDERFRSRAGTNQLAQHLPVALRVYALADPEGDARPVAGRLERREALLFAYSNPPEAGVTHLAVVARDGAGDVHWLIPGPEPVGVASEPIRAAPDLLELPVAIEVPWNPGAATLYALFSARALDVEAVERWLRAGAPASGLPAGARALRVQSFEVE